MRSLIGELSSASVRFRELRAHADVEFRVGVFHMRHPVVGDLYLHQTGSTSRIRAVSTCRPIVPTPAVTPPERSTR
ncbi:hypothetical protein [Mycobacterium sp.]|uniref:MmyB family transcriptional regulator n=1 Tax=Mycobacterium sp. TaxID=1785 RepID=UPI0025E3F46D|nr:hypothetical protein [Mycobacterium sp.]